MHPSAGHPVGRVAVEFSFKKFRPRQIPIDDILFVVRLAEFYLDKQLPMEWASFGCENVFKENKAIIRNAMQLMESLKSSRLVDLSSHTGARAGR